MATLNPSNVINGNVIQASDILQLFEAFGTGSQNITGLSLTGSITNAITALTSSITNNIIVPVTSSGIYYPVIVDGAGTKPPRILSTFELSGSVLNNITASRAITASFALNASISQVNDQRYISVSNPATVSSDNFKFIAGGGTLNAGILTSSAYPPLAGKTMGQNVWITVTYTGDLAAITSPAPTLGVNLSSSGAIIIEQLTPQNDSEVVWTGMYI